MTGLTIPDLPEDVDTLKAALTYAAAGLFVGPLRRGTKSPGSRLGDDWPDRTSRDPAQIAAWFAATDDGLFLHAGRSGVVVFDVDRPGNVPDEHRALLWDDDDPLVPYQSTRPDVPHRGHYVFLAPTDREVGSSAKNFPGEWGEIRAGNAVVVLYPTPHPDGGRYHWERTGTITPLPQWAQDRLVAPGSGGGLSNAAAGDWIKKQPGSEGPPCRTMAAVGSEARERMRAAGSRHDAMVGRVQALVRLAEEGHVGVWPVLQELFGVFAARVTTEDGPGKRSPAVAQEEFGRALVGAIARVIAVPTFPEPMGDPCASGATAQPLGGQGQPHQTTETGAPTAQPEGEMSHVRDSWDAVDLLRHSFPHLVWAIPEFYPPGAVILSGPPKQGKSFLALASGVAVATGSTFLRMATTKGRVLYCALEDGARRAQLRLRMMPGHKDLEPGMLTIRTVAPRVDEGLLDILNQWVAQSSSFTARLIVLDVFQRVRSTRTTAGKNLYSEDYSSLEGLQQWANQKGICLVILHHNRKATSDDPFEMISGSTGMTGVVDMVMILRGQRGAKEAGLYVSGRDTKFDHDYSLVRRSGIWEPGLMPVDLATAAGRTGFARDTWKFLHERAPVGATTAQVAVHKGTTEDSVRHHLGNLAERGWVKALNPPSPGAEVRWVAVTDDCWVDLPLT